MPAFLAVLKTHASCLTREVFQFPCIQFYSREKDHKKYFAEVDFMPANASISHAKHEKSLLATLVERIRLLRGNFC